MTLLESDYSTGEESGVLPVLPNPTFILGDWRCIQCNEFYTEEEHLNDHMKLIHNGVPMYLTIDINKDQLSESMIQDTSIESAKFKFARQESEKMSDIKQSLIFMCETCAETYNSEIDFDEHRETTHNYNKEETYLGDECFKCDTCSRKFTAKRRLKNHMKIHENR